MNTNNKQKCEIKQRNSRFRLLPVTNRLRGHRSAMAAPGKTISTAVSSSPVATSFDFSADSQPLILTLTADQLRNCSEALKFFKAKKFDSPQTIRQEFLTLQVYELTYTYISVNCHLRLLLR